MITKSPHNQTLTTVYKTRLLPTWGKVLVRVGQEVDATEAVAEAKTNLQHSLINIAYGLGVSIDKCEEYIKRDIGDNVNEGSIIAERGKSGRIVRAPRDGVIISIDNGVILLQSNNEITKLKAGFPGKVEKLITSKGVIVSSTGYYIEGTWGNGNINTGLLPSITTSHKEPLEMDMLKSEHQNIVSFAAWCDDPSIFKFAIDNDWKGMIFGSLPAKYIPILIELPFPVLLLEGFGKVSIDSKTFELLNSNLGKNISVDAIPNLDVVNNKTGFFIPSDDRSKTIPPNHDKRED